MQEKGNLQYSMTDCLNTAYSIFFLKDPSVVYYRREYPNQSDSLNCVYGIGKMPDDTAMRETLDGLRPFHLQE